MRKSVQPRIYFNKLLSIFCYLALGEKAVTNESVAVRRTTLALFLAFIQFPIGFVFHLQRPETMPTTLFLAIGLLCLAKAETNRLWIALLFLVTACQAFVRADVPFVFGVALVVLGLSGNLLWEFGPRYANFFLGICVMLIAGGVQSYLQFVRFPHKHYGKEGVVMLSQNLRSGHVLVFALSLLPFLLAMALVAVRRRRLRSIEVMVIAASALYLPIWVIVGSVAEVRIFVPFLLALCVIAAPASASYITAPAT